MLEKKKDKVCLLDDPKVVIAPQDPGEPPSWVPSLPGVRIFWVDRDVFDALIARRHDKPCDICPSEIKEQCCEEVQRSKRTKMPEKKFAIDEDLVKEVSKTLQAFINHIDADCARSGCMCDLGGEVCSQRISDVLHNFDSDLCLIESPVDCISRTEIMRNHGSQEPGGDD